MRNLSWRRAGRHRSWSRSQDGWGRSVSLYRIGRRMTRCNHTRVKKWSRTVQRNFTWNRIQNWHIFLEGRSKNTWSAWSYLICNWIVGCWIQDGIVGVWMVEIVWLILVQNWRGWITCDGRGNIVISWWESLNTKCVRVLCQNICVDRSRLGNVGRPSEVLGELWDRALTVDG